MTLDSEYRREDETAHPPHLFEAYRSTALRSPMQPLIRLPQMEGELSGPVGGGAGLLGPAMADLTRQHRGEPLGQRIKVAGRVLDEDGRAVPNTLIEIWQANAAGRYIHARDQWDAPIDPNFTGMGRVVTDEEGRYLFTTIRPGAYPWGNHHNAWRPAHIHFSLLGPAFATRLVTQMYFEGDPLIALDPIAQAVPADACERLVARFDLSLTEPSQALGYAFDIVLRGHAATPMEA
ncbi:MAG: protocatechuate 3,4-dioxygenase subunit beta [Phenylobacterium sp.]|uniref:protocatechuate 3,4-dioxygenase subunit beta n=1 Tax=Phenylobacterium sp. TaxID=1871053 RepID=UPI0025F38249|nr:protocatechuate 3,4-dioxygenase subunit beta [Phenylobacterium sp.]MBI1198637.1 protocatechuate 3,4-dioxygenase subunit beta [Phenylobacterium sp.]